jgi:NADP-reducing hydrogenase subunit HndB
MSAIKSLEDLKRLREEALEKRKVKSESGSAQVIVAMGTCGIAAGARETMKSILNEIETDNLSGIVVTQTGCIGLCEREPIVQVVIGENPKVTYGKVTPEVARRILKEHVLGGKPVQDFVIRCKRTGNLCPTSISCAGLRGP